MVLKENKVYNLTLLFFSFYHHSCLKQSFCHKSSHPTSINEVRSLNKRNRTKQILEKRKRWGDQSPSVVLLWRWLQCCQLVETFITNSVPPHQTILLKSPGLTMQVILLNEFKGLSQVMAVDVCLFRSLDYFFVGIMFDICMCLSSRWFEYIKQGLWVLINQYLWNSALPSSSRVNGPHNWMTHKRIAEDLEAWTREQLNGSSWNLISESFTKNCSALSVFFLITQF